ncbi:hypothetical protein [Inhella gelatinilytica]|uniref:Outer membrane protein beta-barrel domain-containing protein n=1 Tax=Inhella gelatinilytica TaxID=2795030 RepID=A0A931IRS1_9BURK|nr:hypothetical protein [Inhella gelatinilytica]MBH9551482.1 hypothetical protein [Inhella gelatinilytica]
MKTLKFGLVAAGLLVAAASHAGAPMATEDADVLSPGQCEWETVAERAKAAGISAHGWNTGFQCQAIFSTQMGLAFGRATAEGVSASSLTLSGKTGLIERKGDGLGLTLAWGLESLRLPGRSGYRQDAHFAKWVMSYGLGAWTVHGNVGWMHSKLADETVRATALGVGYALNDAVELLAESYGEQGSPRSYGVGVRTVVNDWTFGAMATQDRGSPKTRSFTLSAKMGF